MYKFYIPHTIIPYRPYPSSFLRAPSRLFNITSPEKPHLLNRDRGDNRGDTTTRYHIGLGFSQWHDRCGDCDKVFLVLPYYTTTLGLTGTCRVPVEMRGIRYLRRSLRINYQLVERSQAPATTVRIRRWRSGIKP
jgi:hypothetical protein